jgi:hypothetical protein
MTETGINRQKLARLVDSGYELVFDDGTIMLPVFAIFD